MNKFFRIRGDIHLLPELFLAPEKLLCVRVNVSFAGNMVRYAKIDFKLHLGFEKHAPKDCATNAFLININDEDKTFLVLLGIETTEVTSPKYIAALNETYTSGKANYTNIFDVS